MMRIDMNIYTTDNNSFNMRFLENAVVVIEKHMAITDFNMDLFSGNLNMSKSSLYRRIKFLTQLSPNEFTKNIRLKHACQLLRNQQLNISEIAYAVGFSDPKYFTACFKIAYGMTPTEYLKKLREESTEKTAVGY